MISNSSNLTYSCDQLLQLSKKYKLPPSAWATIISDLGIRKRLRGSKAGNKQGTKIKIQSTGNYSSIRILHQQPMNLSAPSSNNIDESDAPKLNFAVWNARSTKAKTFMVCDLIISHELDILGITESWVTGTHRDDPIIADFKA